MSEFAGSYYRAHVAEFYDHIYDFTFGKLSERSGAGGASSQGSRGHSGPNYRGKARCERTS